MNFEWDEQKRRDNLQKHGIDFVDVTQVFKSPMFVRLDTRYDYGEDRWIGIGIAQNRVVTVIYTESDEGETIRLISARKALKHERKRYEEYLLY